MISREKLPGTVPHWSRLEVRRRSPREAPSFAEVRHTTSTPIIEHPWPWFTHPPPSTRGLGPGSDTRLLTLRGGLTGGAYRAAASYDGGCGCMARSSCLAAPLRGARTWGVRRQTLGRPSRRVTRPACIQPPVGGSPTNIS